MRAEDKTSLKGRVALVTGSGRNIGRAIALELAERGADVIVNTRANAGAAEAVVGQAKKRGVRALALMADVGKSAEVRRLAERALAEFGRVDIVINNAAIRPERPFLELGEEDWHRVLDVDLHSAFYTAKAFLPGMVAQRWGRIVNLTGMNAIQGHAGRVHVSTAKHAGCGGSPRRWRGSSVPTASPSTPSRPAPSKASETIRRAPSTSGPSSAASPWAGWGRPRTSRGSAASSPPATGRSSRARCSPSTAPPPPEPATGDSTWTTRTTSTSSSSADLTACC